jgi:hypothetical protein
MRSAWRRYLLLRSVIFTLVCLAIGLGVWHMRGIYGQLPAGTSAAAVSLQAGTAADNQPKDQPAEPRPQQTVPKAAPSQLITLHEAVDLIEKANKGEVVRVEKIGEGSAAQYDVDVLGKNGVRNLLRVSANGMVILETKAPNRNSTATKGKRSRGGF